MTGPTWQVRLLRAYWRASRGMTLGVRVAAFDAQGRICLVRHTYTTGLHFPGGGVERDQTLLDAAVDEFTDETGFDVEPADLTLIGVYLNRAFRGDHVALFRTDRVRPRGGPNPREIADVVWAEPGALPEGVTRATRARIAELTAGAPPSPYW
ncbi:MAG: NUDIX domain-containing protein [Pseudomonadota bacterium]